MTHAELLRSHANLAIKEGGMYYSGEYLSRMADVAESLEAENSKLRELVRELWGGYADPPCEECPLKNKSACVDCPICAREAAVIDHMRELGIEVDA